MEIIAILIYIIFIGLIAWLYVGGVEYMKNNHPDYKGKDFFLEDE